MWNCTTAANDKLCRQLRSCMRSKEETILLLFAHADAVSYMCTYMYNISYTGSNNFQHVTRIIRNVPSASRRHAAFKEFRRYDRCFPRIYVSFAMTFFSWDTSVVYAQVMLFIGRRNRVS